MRYISTIFILFFLSELVQAQQVQIRGYVLDSLSHEGIVYATIQVGDFTAVISQANGKFDYENIIILDSIYSLRVRHVGYEPKLITFEHKKIIDLGEIYLTPKKFQLDAITVKGKKMRQGVDKTTYLIDDTVRKNAMIAIDVLKSIPELKVNEITGSVDILGRSNPLIFINGINTGASVDLRTINPMDISSVEVITTPSSAIDVSYDAIINVILKEKPQSGFILNTDVRGTLNAGHFDGFAGLTFGTEKVRASFAYDYFYRKTTFTQEETRTDMQTQEIYGWGPNYFNSQENNHMISANVDFYLTDRDFLNLTTNTKFSNSNKIIEKQPYFIDDSVVRKNLAFYENQYKNNYFIGNYTLFYQRKLNDKGDYFSSNLNFGIMEGNEFSGIFYDSGTTSSYNEVGNKYSANLKIDYSQRLIPQLRLSAGAQVYYQYFDGILSGNPNYNKFQNYRYNIYADIYYTFGKYQLRGGIRPEINVNYFEKSKNVIHKGLYPTLMLSRQWDNVNLVLSYRQLSFYPSVWYFAPYQTHVDERSFFIGNPSLKPSLYNLLQFGYTHRTEVITSRTTLYYQHGSRLAIPLSQYDSNFVNWQTISNDAFSQKIGLRWSGNIKVGNFLELTPELGLSYVEYGTSLSRKNSTLFYASMSIETMLPAGIHIGLYGISYTSKMATFQGYYMPQFSIEAIYATKRFKKIGLSVSLGYMNPKVASEKSYIYEGGYEQYNYSQMKPKGFVLRVNWVLNQGKEQEMKRIDTYFDEDKK